ncbi:MAG: PfkB family carbohydrate kinase [Phycisphaerae bacterium]|nr:PfkB family carbohydrate kinase [Phycisphaerae bacterium]
MAPRPCIIGIGEALLDLCDGQAHLGGAPINMAVHAQQLGNEGVAVCRVGQDGYGDRVVAELGNRGVNVEHVQRDPDHLTGTVLVSYGADGEPRYDIVEDVAWDYLQADSDLEYLAARADAVCFGTLAQRSGQTRGTIYKFLDQAKRAIRLLDLNLRPPFYDRRRLEHSCELATAVKANLCELRHLGSLFSTADEPAQIAADLIQRYRLDFVAVTSGAAGTAVYGPDGLREAPSVPVVSVVDPVGAGDAAAAAILHGAVRRWPWERTVALANELAAHVVGQAGACPPIPEPIRALAGTAQDSTSAAS